MRTRKGITGLLVAMIASTFMGVGVLAQDATDTSTVDVQVHSGTFGVSVDSGGFSAVQPGETSTGSVTIEVVDERAGGGYWHVWAGMNGFRGNTSVGTQNFSAVITWNMEEVSPSLVLNNDHQLKFKSAGESMFRGVGATGTSTVSGTATVPIPLRDNQDRPLLSGTYSTTITVELTSEDPT